MVRRVLGFRRSPTGLSWLKSAFVFNSLEACRDFVCDPKRKTDVYCRFTAGDMLHPKDRPDLETIANEIRDLITVKRQLNPEFEKAPQKLVEWLTDFSLSYGTIEAAYGKGEKTPQTFELLMIAESELNGGPDRAMEDFLRLFFIPCPLRVLVFQGKLKDLPQKFMRMLDTHADCVKGQPIDWLFFGVPLYAEWVAHKKSRAGITWQAYLLRSGEVANKLAPIAEKDWA